MNQARLLVALFFLVLSTFSASAVLQQQTVPLPDDDPLHNKVAAPDQSPQQTPAVAGPGAAAHPDDSNWTQTTTISGVKVDFRGVASLKDIIIQHGPLPVSLNEISSSEMVEGQHAVFQFRLTDAAGTPMTGLRMAAWLDQAQNDKLADAGVCHAKVQSFLQMQLSARPEVDLNTYYLLALTREPGILIIDPRVGFSSSKLYAIVDLPAPGADWVQSRSSDRIFVSMPSINKVAVVDSMSFRLIASVSAGGKTGRILMQPDGRYLWVGNDAADGNMESGVTVIDTTTLEVAAHIATGKGHHEIAFDENQNAYVTNQNDNTVSILSVAKLAKLKDVPAGKGPVALAYSARSKNVYVAGRGDGKITVLSAETQNVVGSLAETPGLTALVLTPDGRWGFVANGTENRVSLFDVASNKFVQKYQVGSAPDSLSLTTAYVYVHSQTNEHVSLIPLSEVGSTAHTAEFPAGQNPPGAGEGVLAPTMVASLDGDSAFVANPADKRIYYYQEGMAAPMLSMEGYGKTPVAVMVLDRSIHETSPGVYSVGLTLPKPGLYDVPMFLDSPSISHCFQFSVKANPLLRKKTELAVNLHPLKTNLQVKPGEVANVQFRLVDPETGKPRDRLSDVEVTVLLAEGLRQMHIPAAPLGDGVYQFTFTPPKAGVYYGTVQIPSLRIRANQLPYLMVRAVESQASEVRPQEQNSNAQPKKQ